MDYRKSLLAALVGPLLLIGSGSLSTAQGAGYAVFTQGASALGQGNAVTAHASGPNTIFYNPALMNKLDGTQLEAGTTIIYSTREHDSNVTGAETEKDSVFFPSTFYATHKFNDSISAGFGVFNPFGLGTDWGTTWEGRYLATKSELTTYNFNPVLSYRVIPDLSFAAGLDIIHLDAKLQQKLPGAFFGLPGDLNQKFDGDGTGVGFNVAAAYDITKKATLGASYRSEVEVDIDGTGTVTGLPSSKGKTSVKLPAQLTAGLAYQVSDPLTLEVGIRWEEWSAFKELNIEIEGAPSQVTPRKWHDTLGANLGGKYRLNDTVALMAGYIYGSNAIPTYTFEPAIPDSDTHIFCLGTGLDFSPLKVDLSYAYQHYTNRTKNNDVGAVVAGALGDEQFKANGRYKSDAHLFALSLGYKF